MSLWGRARSPHEVPADSPDLAWVMSFVTSIGGLSAYWTRRSSLGLAAGLGVGATFGLGGWWISSSSPDKHEMAHQLCLIASVLFGGAMGYRAGSNPYVGPGGSMLAALGAVSSAYHATKMFEWRAFEQSRVLEAERLLRNFQRKHPDERAALPLPPVTGPPASPSSSPPDGGRAHGPPHRPGAPPHLDRRSPVPPGGF